MPKRIILVRHGESEANHDPSVWSRIPDNKIHLTERGKAQARDVGVRISKLLDPEEHVRMVVSPFERTMQTADEMRKSFEGQITYTQIEPRVREQEMGNLQREEIQKRCRKEQEEVGRFFYRFPTGESGCDVYDRTSNWFEGLLRLNAEPYFPKAETVVVVTHGLTMRCVLMMLYGWSPNTFHTIWNAGNCSISVLAKDLGKPGMHPYVIDEIAGDKLASSIMLKVTVNSGEELVLRLNDYLSVPPRRMCRLSVVKQMLAEQHQGIDENDIVGVEGFSGKHTEPTTGRTNSYSFIGKFEDAHLQEISNSRL